jgi:hypothetical protein
MCSDGVEKEKKKQLHKPTYTIAGVHHPLNDFNGGEL